MSNAASRWFHDTVSALVYSFAEGHATSPLLEPPHNDLTQFILAQHRRMPDYLRTPMLAATLTFDLLGILQGGTRFHRQPPARRKPRIEKWKDSNRAFPRDLMRYFESLALVALYSRLSADAPESGSLAPSSPAGNDALHTRVIETPNPELHAHNVVIGSGPGGAISACLLAESGRQVLLIEEGPFLPTSSCPAFSQTELQHKYRNGGQTVALGANKIAYVEGRCVGGGSEINSGLYHRTPPEVLENWRKEFRVEGLEEKEMAPHFAACERDLSVSLLPGPPPAASRKLREGAIKLGWKSLEVPRWFRYDASSPARAKQTMTETYIPRFLAAGGRLLPATRARRLRQTGAQWCVETHHEKVGRVRIIADHAFLCAGAVQTPALLRRSGVTRNIGNSLRFHPTVKMVARFDEEVNALDMGVPVHQVKEFAPRLSLGCSISSPAYLALGLIDHPAAARATSQMWRNAAVYYAMITSEGHGSVRNLPGFRDPVVRYNLTIGDRRNLADGLHKLAEDLLAAGATALYPGFKGSPALRSKQDLGKLPDTLPGGMASLMTIHLFSSCPMGEDQTKCATDSFGRVHGFKNLFVNDASLLCTAPGVNPQGSIMALARRNVVHFLQAS
ncbi:Uncharacterized GMC-type oxidoreductase y4nJ (modular protein) [Verrucomicrobia bacterium]|nr:Uncharacterized GMC-type oxidoreductase y4nJ (modular protein) [Verrucomicrobiota bacterium]